MLPKSEGLVLREMKEEGEVQHPHFIGPDMTVREVLRRYPVTAQVFDKHGLAGCGGPQGPEEPLAFFARVHQVDPEELLRELEECVVAAQEKAQLGTPTAAGRQVNTDVYPAFFKASLFFALTGGFTLGTYALLSGRLGAGWRLPLAELWLPLVQAHGHVQLFGWVGLFLMGAAYHILPRFKGVEPPARLLPLLSLGLVAAALVLRLIGQPSAGYLFGAGLMLLSGLLLTAGVALFASLLLPVLFARGRPVEFWQKYVVAGLVWLLLVVVANLALVSGAALGGSIVLPAVADSALLQAAFLGFVASFIFGVSLRTLPLFMGLRPTNTPLANAAFWPLNAAVAIGAAATAASQVASEAVPLNIVVAAAALLGASAVVALIHSLGLFLPGDPSSQAVQRDRAFEPFIRAAYLWLVAGVGLMAFLSVRAALGGAQVGYIEESAARHALATGFISMMIIGMAVRIVPTFSGRPLANRALLPVILVSLNLGTFLRVWPNFLGLSDGLLTPLLGLSAVLSTAAIACFAAVVWRPLSSGATVGAPVAAGPKANGRLGPINVSWTVAEVLECKPAALQVFLDHGLVQLANPVLRAAMAPTVTIGQAARIHSIPLDGFLAALNKAGHPEGDKSA